MAQRKPEEDATLEQVLKLAHQLTPRDRERLRYRLDLQAADENWESVKDELTRKRTADGLPVPTDEDVHEKLSTLRNDEKLDLLRAELDVGLRQLDEGKSVPAAQVIERLRKRADQRLKDSQADE